MPIRPTHGLSFFGSLVLALAALVLAAEPVLWLVETWLDPSYASIGGYVWVVVVGLFAWSATSPIGVGPSDSGKATALLLLTAVVRLVGRLTATNVIGALALVADVYALGLLGGLARRQRALSPGWLALSFSFALPFERLIQRTMGFSLQQLSAAGACQVVKVGFDDVVCAGTRIAVAGHDVMVDLPCSGARGLVQLLFLFAVLATLARPRLGAGLAGFAVAVAAGLLGNTMRISLLAIGIARPTFGVDVMTSTWHGVIGLFCLAVAAAPIVLWARWVSVGRPRESSHTAKLFERRGRLQWTTARALLFAVVAGAVVVLPARPLDVAARIPSPSLPQSLGGEALAPLPLSPKERDYFTAYGGGAAKGSYGPHTLLIVQTTSPLRHLHAPDECLAGSGHEVERLGLSFAGPLPSAVYRSVAPNGATYRVAVTYVDDQGVVALSVAEVVWHWLKDPGRTWTAIERISLWDMPLDSVETFDLRVARAFELTKDSTITEVRHSLLFSTRGYQ